MPMIQLVYVSSATHLMSEDDIMQILRVSRRNNANAGITGLLLYKDGNFLQVLEGEEDKVVALYNKIGQDSRHKDVHILSREVITERMFDEWTMGFQNVGRLNPKDIPGYSAFLSQRFTQEELNRPIRRLDVLLRTFRDIISR